MFKLFTVLVLLTSLTSLVHAAIDCDGDDDRLNTIVNLSNFVLTGTGTVIVRLTTTVIGNPDGDVCWPGSQAVGDGGGYLVIATRDDNGGEACVFDYFDDYVYVATAHTLNVPHSIVLLNSGGNINMYYDGAFIGNAATNGPGATDNVLRVCSAVDGFPPITGRIHEVRISNTAYTAAQIKGIHTAKRRRRVELGTTVTGHWTFDNCTPGNPGNGVGFQDMSGLGRTLTGDDGANNAGLTCRTSEVSTLYGGIQ